MSAQVDETQKPADTATPSGKEGVSFLMSLVIAAGFAAVGALMAVLYMQAHQPKPEIKVLFADGNAIYKAKMESVIAAKVTDQAAIEKSALDFTKALSSVLDKYRNDGFLVLNSKAVMTLDPEKDVTKELAAAVGVSLNASVPAK